MMHRSTLSLLLALVMVALAAPAQAYETELRAYRETMDAFFDEALTTKSDCEGMGTALSNWLTAHEAELVARAEALAKAFENVPGPAEFSALDTSVSEMWSAITSHEGLVLVGACLNENDAVAQAVKRFDALGTEPVTVARDKAFARLDKEAEKNRPANRDLAKLAADTLSRTLSLYGNAVASYGGNCQELARALDAWHGNYFEILDGPSRDLVGELDRMTAAEKVAFAANLERIKAARASTEKVKSCVDQLEGDAKERMSFQLTFLSVYVIDSVMAAAQ